MFSVLFEISVYRNAYVESLLERLVEGQSRNCCVEFIRNFNDWEIDELASFFTFVRLSCSPWGGE